MAFAFAQDTVTNRISGKSVNLLFVWGDTAVIIGIVASKTCLSMPAASFGISIRRNQRLM